MNIYKHEIDAGLGELIKNNALAYSSEISFIDKPEDIFDMPKATAQTWDLFPFNSILASTGWNENDDVFDVMECWNSKNTSFLKQVNYMHNEAEIIGVTTSSVAVADGKIITEPQDQFDIVVAASLYRIWQDPQKQERMNNIISGIANNEWFVSMECLFKHFDYAVIKDGVHSWIPRNESTSFLTKHLRIYGGKGEYNGHRIGRLLRNFTFSGMGLVTNPANKRSVILNTFNAKAELIMEKNYELELANKETELVKAQAKIEKLQEDLQSKVEAAAKAEQDKLIKDIEKLNITIAEEKEEKEKAKKDLEDKDKKLDEVSKANKVLEEELAKAKAELEKISHEKKVADRRSQLVTAGVVEVEPILTAWSSASDEQFAQIIELVKPKSTQEVDFSKANLEAGVPNNPDESVEKPELAQAAQNYFIDLFKKQYNK